MFALSMVLSYPRVCMCYIIQCLRISSYLRVCMLYLIQGSACYIYLIQRTRLLHGHILFIFQNIILSHGLVLSGTSVLHGFVLSKTLEFYIDLSYSKHQSLHVLILSKASKFCTGFTLDRILYNLSCPRYTN